MFIDKQRYNKFGPFLRDTFGERVFKICIDAGFTCPNIDGTKARGGCIYCNNDSFRPNTAEAKLSVTEQLNRGIAYQKKRYNAKHFIAYFQAFSSTYGDIEYLDAIYNEALSHPLVVGLSIGTRPDCVNKEILDLIGSLAKRTYVWIEYGLQSMHDKTLDLINRGHDLLCFHNTYMETRKYKEIMICAHVIHGLPLETVDMQLDTIKYLSDIKVDGIKIHQLHVVRRTLLERMYKKGQFTLLSLDEYLDLLAQSLSLLSPKVVIQRLFGLGPLDILIAPDWNLKKGAFNTLIDNYLENRDCYQGSQHKYFSILEKYSIGVKKEIAKQIENKKDSIMV